MILFHHDNNAEELEWAEKIERDGKKNQIDSYFKRQTIKFNSIKNTFFSMFYPRTESKCYWYQILLFKRMRSIEKI